MPTRIGADPLWHTNAVLYELHVRTFCDGNADGIGDFTGLTRKLDYLARLGVTCLWLLPFFESPMLDDGYDVSHYDRVDPRYGTLGQFTRFLDEAHARGLRVITELVLNHTSDQHPWFQAARRAPAGSNARNFYVWSDTDQRYLGARVIFRDYESSNWAWDPVAGAYYWHRFYRHQPDLNFENPHVQRAILDVMRFWLDLGVDGLRLDAAPHLFEREGTSCENLPETHQFLKRMRAEIDRGWADRVIVAEANERPADVLPYFGDDDECHMAFHFPLMPRIFMALKREDAGSIVDIVQRTSPTPGGCQWAVFLRSHDELTLSALSESDRDFMVAAYAPDRRMRLNRGIRRRLAPLLGNDRSRLELANAILFALPGSPVIYYGDEIGMGDNVALPDRDGLRTPMQWSAEPNGGFSIADPSRLVLPPVDDEEYGFRTVNVASQQDDPRSLLSWMTRLIALRQRHPVLGRGEIAFLDAGTSGVLAFLRRGAGDAILVVANLSASGVDVRLPLPGWEGHAVEDLLYAAPMPPVADGPYAIELPRHACRWLKLSEARAPA